MIDNARPAIGSLGSDGHLSPQALSRNQTLLGDVSTSDPAPVHAGTYHPCRGFGRDAGRCSVIIPDDRWLCHYCTRSQALARVGETVVAIDPSLFGDVACPNCDGILNELDHFNTLGHRLGVGDYQLVK